MIFVTDKGQMCNNMFQYMQLYAWGRENGRNTMSMRFAHMYPYFAICHYPYQSKFFYFLAKALSACHLIPTINFDKASSLEEGLNRIAKSRHCLVKGWCWIRFPELVGKYISEIKQMFAFDDEMLSRVKGKMNRNAEISVGIHIRRGDYKTFKNGAFFFNDDEYIETVNRLLSFLSSGKKVQVYICTNDMKLNKDYFVNSINADVKVSDGTGEEDFCLLSMCDYVVGPVSSYSLMSTLYGKARLFWMSHKRNANELTLEQFGDFYTMSRRLDDCFNNA